MALQTTSVSAIKLPVSYTKITKAIKKHLLKRFNFLKVDDISDYIIQEYAKKYTVNDDKYTKQLLKYIVDDLVVSVQEQHRLKLTLPSTSFDEKVETKEYFISIDSKDRNYEQWPNANEYSIDFGGNHNNYEQTIHDGYVNSIYMNIESVELISVVVPKFSDTGNHINNYPYLLLEVEELAGIYDGSNKHVTNAFAKLRFQTDLGYFKEYTLNGGERFIKHFHPRITLNRMTIRFKRPDGELYNFGSVINPLNNTTNSSSASDTNSTLDSKLEQLLLQDPSTLSSSINTVETSCPCDVQIPCENTLVFKIVCHERKMNTHLFQ